MENTLPILVEKISNTHLYFQKQAAKQVDTFLTLRNWVIGYYLFEYEQQGADRATYGDKLYKNVSQKLKENGLSGMSFTNLHLFKQFYLIYPQIIQTVSEQFNIKQISQEIEKTHPNSPEIKKLLSKLTFSHFVELLKADSSIKRAFYEIESIKNGWSVRDLQRAMNSLLFERTGLSHDKKGVLEAHVATEQNTDPSLLIRNPFVLEFLGLPENKQFSESQLESTIIDKLQSFLMEAGRGFCFEARQKRITFDNTHYKIDLVFYHRILKCHVLIDLKIGEFSHADAGQMNVYLNYYREEEMTDGDNLPIGIILCSHKNESLVKYATGNLNQQVFVSKYLINLPKEEELIQLVSQ
jgi:predicted nuclease of restriction endonuclease-like (RecB) superfamily